MAFLRAQGATEYLVLLAIVLVVALVSVSLLGFFPGTASDAQLTQSKTYWSSASPIAIVEWDAADTDGGGYTFPYLRLRNIGPYPIRITSVIGAGGQIYLYNKNGAPSGNISQDYYLAPGEENFFGWNVPWGMPRKGIYFYTAAWASYSVYLSKSSSICSYNSSNAGILQMNNFGFEYIEYLDNGQQITKQEIGSKPLMIKCQQYP